MANRYWVGGTGSWNDTTHWSTTSGGTSGASVPTSADDVIFDTNMGFSGVGTGSIFLTVGAECHNFDARPNCGSGNVPNFDHNYTNLNVHGSYWYSIVGPTLTVGLILRNAVITMKSTSPGEEFQALANGSNNFVHLTFDGVGGEWLVTAFLTFFQILTLTNGSVTVADGVNFEAQTFELSNSNVRGLDLGLGTLVVCKTWDASNTTNFTFNAGTSLIDLKSNLSFANDYTTYQLAFYGGSLTYYDVKMECIRTLSRGNYGQFIDGGVITGANTYHDLTLVSTSPSRCVFESGVTQTVTGTFSATGAATTRLLLSTGYVDGETYYGSPAVYQDFGSPVTINAAVASLSYTDFMDFTGAGAATWSGTRLGNGGGNTSLSFDSPVTRYWVGNAGDWFDTTHWAASSGGAGSQSIPICHDAVIFDANSFSSASQTVTLKGVNIVADLDFSAVTHNPTIEVNYDPTFTIFIPFSGNLIVIGSTFKLSPNMSLTAVDNTPSMVFLPRQSSTLEITSAGHKFWNSYAVWLIGLNDTTIKLMDDLIYTGGMTEGFMHVAGTFDANDFNVSVGAFGSTATYLFINTFPQVQIFHFPIYPRTLLMRSGTWTVDGSFNQATWDFSDPTGLTIDAGTSEIVMRVSAYAAYFYGGGLTYNNASFSGLDDEFSLLQTMQLTGGNTFNDLSFTSPSFTVVLEDGSTQTVQGTFTSIGESGKEIYIQSHGSNNNPIESGAIVNGGSGYQVNDLVTVDPTGLFGQFRITAVDGGGAATAVEVDTDNPGMYYTNGVHTTTFTSPDVGKITGVSIVDGGTGYTNGDTPRVTPNVGEPVTDSGYLEILGVDGGGTITSIHSYPDPMYDGVGYTDGNHAIEPFSGGSDAIMDITVFSGGSGMTLDIVVADPVGVESFIYAVHTVASYTNVQNNHARGAVPFEDFPGGVDGGGNSNWCFTSGCRITNLYLQNVFMIGADTDGKVQTINIGKSDDGTPIYYDLETQDIELGNRSHLKQVSNQIAIFTRFGAQSNLQAKSDMFPYKDISLVMSDRVNIGDKIDLTGHWLTFKWFGSSTTVSPVFEGIYLEDINDFGITHG